MTRGKLLVKQVDCVALRLCLTAQRAPDGLQATGARNIPPPDAALGDGFSRSATKATIVATTAASVA